MIKEDQIFSNELIILPKLIDSKQVDYTKLYGSWVVHLVFFNLCQVQLRIMPRF